MRSLSLLGTARHTVAFLVSGRHRQLWTFLLLLQSHIPALHLPPLTTGLSLTLGRERIFVVDIRLFWRYNILDERSIMRDGHYTT